MKIYYNPLNKKYKSITGAVPSNAPVTFSIYAETDSARFLIKNDNDLSFTSYEMKRIDNNLFSIELNFKENGLFFYYFVLGNTFSVGKGANYIGVIAEEPRCYQLTVFKEEYQTPQWLKGGLIYQIFPDRFCKVGDYEIEDGKTLHSEWGDTPNYKPIDGKILNNDFFGGNFKGIESKIPYLKDLGVSLIYLNPIFKAYSNHRYDTGDYMTLDPLLGKEEDFKSLIKTADSFNIKIILDGVFNHTGSDSIYFNKYGKYDTLGAFQSKNSPYYKWYNFINYPKVYDAWWGIDTLPAINESNSEFIEYITGENGVLAHYIKMGVAGWRLDVADELPIFFMDKIRSAVKKAREDGVVIGEVWEDATNKIAYSQRRPYFQGDQLDSVMNYPLKDAIISFVKSNDAKQLAFVIKEQIDHYPKCALDCLMNILGTHDTYRILTVLGDNLYNKSVDEMAVTSLTEEQLIKAKEALKFATVLQFTLYGVPSVYYGDEVGVQGYRDPFNRRCFPWGKEDKELLAWYKRLGEIRKNLPLFIDGEYNEVYLDSKFLVYERRKGDDVVFIALNRSNTEYYLNFDGVLYNLLNGKKYEDKVSIKPFECGIFYSKML